MKKRLVLSLVFVLLAIMLGGSALAEDKTMTIKLASLAAPNPFESAAQAGFLVFKDEVENNSGGRIKVELYSAGTLGNETDTLEATLNGVVQLFSASGVALNRIYPPSFTLASPYLFRNSNVAWAVCEGPFGKKLLDDFTAKTGIKGLAIIPLGFNAITNNVRPLRKPEDFKGIKFRGMGKIQVAMFEAMGGAAVPISWTEVYTSLQTGVVQGQTNPPAIIYAFKIHEVQKYLSLCNSQFGHQYFVANKAWYDALSKDDRQIIDDAVQVAITTVKGMSSLLNQQAVDNLIKAGVQVERLSGDEIKALQATAGPACLDWVKKQVDPKWVDELVAAIDETEKQLGYK